MRKKRTVEAKGPGFYARRRRKRQERIRKRDEKDPFYWNKGWFKPGFDERRHKFTKEECELGYRCAVDGLMYHYKFKKRFSARAVLNRIIHGTSL